MENAEIIQAELMAHNITLCRGCKNGCSHTRGIAFPDSRTIHYSRTGATRATLYGFLHEVGHIVMGHGKASKLRRFEEEEQAEEYARESFRQLGLVTPRKQVALGNAYVARWKRFGDRVKAGRRG